MGDKGPASPAGQIFSKRKTNVPEDESGLEKMCENCVGVTDVNHATVGAPQLKVVKHGKEVCIKAQRNSKDTSQILSITPRQCDGCGYSPREACEEIAMSMKSLMDVFPNVPLRNHPKELAMLREHARQERSMVLLRGLHKVVVESRRKSRQKFLATLRKWS